jgi:hypothetical protein
MRHGDGCESKFSLLATSERLSGTHPLRTLFSPLIINLDSGTALNLLPTSPSNVFCVESQRNLFFLSTVLSIKRVIPDYRYLRLPKYFLHKCIRIWVASEEFLQLISLNIHSTNSPHLP